MNKIFQSTSDKYGADVYNTTKDDFVNDLKGLGHNVSLFERFDGNGDFLVDGDGDCVLIEYNQKNIDDNVVLELV